MFNLYLLFLASIFVSGTSLFVARIAGQHFNISPANVVLGVAFVASLLLEYRSVNSALPVESFVRVFRTSIINTVTVPRAVAPLLFLAVALWAFMLISLMKDLPFIGTQSLLTGIAGIGSLWFTLRSIRRIDQLVTVVKLFVALTAVTAVLTILASSDLLAIRTLPLVTFPSVLVPEEFESFIPGFDRDIVFGFGSDTLGVTIITAIAVLLGFLISRASRAWYKLWGILVLMTMIFTAVIMQSRGLWVSLPIFLSLLVVLVVTRGVLARLRPIAVSILVALVVVAFAVVIDVVGGPQKGEALSRFYNENPTTLFGRTIPREFVFNAALRLSSYEEAWDVLKNRPFLGATVDNLGTRNSHSSYADIVMVAGVGPLIVLGLMVGFTYWQIGIRTRLPYPWFEISVGLVVGLLLMNLFFFGIFQKSFLMVLGIVVLLPTLLRVPGSATAERKNAATTNQ